MADAENKDTRRRSDQEVGKKVGMQTRSGAATKSSTTIGVRMRGGAALRQATIKHGADNVVGKKAGVRMRSGEATKKSTTIGVRTRSAAATKRQSQRKKLEVIPTLTSSWQEPGQQSPDQPVEHGAENEFGNKVRVYTGRRAAAKRQVNKLEVISTTADPRQQTHQEQPDQPVEQQQQQPDRPNQQPYDQPPAEHQQPNVDQHQQNHQQLDEHGAGGIPLQHHNTDDGCRRVFKNKGLRDLFVEPTGSNFDEAVADDGCKRYCLSKIATMHDAPHGQSDKGPDQSGQPDLRSEGQRPNSDGESSSEKAKSRISGSTRSTATSDPRLLVYTAEEVERLVAQALARQEIWHRADMDVVQQRNADTDHFAFLIKTLFDKTGFDLPEYPGISGEVQDAQGKPSNPHQ